MSKFNANMDDFFSGEEQQTAPAPKKMGRPVAKATGKKDFKKVNGANKKDNYAFTIKVDALNEEYLKKIEWIKYIETRETHTKNSFVNSLIRADLIKTLKLKDNASDQEIYDKWQEYKKANNI